MAVQQELKYFFSYARADSEFVLRLAGDLRAAGVPLWLDQLDIAGGERWDQAIERALESCLGVVVVLSPDAISSANVMDEVSYALEKGKLVIPVILRTCAVPFRLRRLQQVDFAQEYDVALGKLLNALSATKQVSIERASDRPPRLQPKAPVTRGDESFEHAAWNDSIVNVDETFSAAEKAKAAALVAFLCSALAEKGWIQDRISVVEFAATELLDNAFLHGLVAREGNVRLLATLTSDLCDITISDDGPGFDLQSHLRRQLESTEPHELRGLAHVHRLATELAQPNSNTLLLRVKRSQDRIKLSELEGIHFLQLAGRMDMSSISKYEKEVARAMDAAKGGKNIAVDLSLVDYMSSVGLRMLMLLAKAAREGGTQAVVFSPQPLVTEIFEISRFDKVLPLANTKEEAIALLGQGPQQAAY